MREVERQFILTAAWLFLRHGCASRARMLVEALVEDDPRDGVSAAAFSEMLLEEGRAEEALAVLRSADFPRKMARVEAILEARSLVMSGRSGESERRWKRYVDSLKGGRRTWKSQ